MFGAKYSRLTFWIWSVLLMIPQIFVTIISYAPMGDIENTSSSTLLFVFFILMLPSLLWMNTLANRIRDYGSNPWIAVFSLVPLVNIGLALYYGTVQYKKKPVESNTNDDDNNSSSLTKAVYNHTKDIASEIKPTINEYREKHQTSKTDTSNISSIDEDAIYEKVMIEIEENNKVKSTWAKALAQSEGDRDKAEALYINLRFEKLKKEFIKTNNYNESNTKYNNKKVNKDMNIELSVSEKENKFLEKYDCNINSINVIANEEQIIIRDKDNCSIFDRKTKKELSISKSEYDLIKQFQEEPINSSRRKSCPFCNISISANSEKCFKCNNNLSLNKLFET